MIQARFIKDRHSSVFNKFDFRACHPKSVGFANAGLNQTRIDLRDKPFRSSYEPFESNGCNEEGCPYQDAEDAPDKRIRMLG
jgi:hypothetical protein